MALQYCRPSISCCRNSTRTLASCLRTYSTEPPSSTTTTTTAPTPESFRPTANAGPRWKQTPAGMKAPLQLDYAKSPRNKVWSVNNDPGRLDEMYNRLLGPGGNKLLPEELKWLAVTHKSFDQGRRGFNDRLALIGRLTMVMEATKEIVSRKPLEGSIVHDKFDRQPLENEQLLSVDNLNVLGPKDIVGKEKLYQLAVNVGMLEVVRWKPRLTQKLESSGVEVVLNSAIMAIIGAITLQHGSAVASQVVRERILTHMPKNK